MNLQPAFQMTKLNDLAAFIAARRFATLVVSGPEGPVAAHIPMIAHRDAEGRVCELEGHVARNNPVAAIAAAGARALAIFNGADAYVSPAHYVSKAEHGRVVPTWNYIAVEAAGRLEAFNDAEALGRQVAALTDMMELGAPTPWAISDAPETYVAQMLNGITGVRLAVDSLQGIEKLSQNRTEADRLGVQQALARSLDPAARMIADRMTSSQTRTTTEPPAR
jgi:transcriptional regulator